MAFPKDVTCEDAPGYHQLLSFGPIGDPAHYALGSFLDPMPSGFRLPPAAGGNPSAAYKARASIDAHGGLQTDSLPSGLQRWLPALKFSSRTATGIELEVGLTDVEYASFSNTIFVLDGYITDGNAGLRDSKKCRDVTDARKLLCTDGYLLATTTVVATPIVYVRTMDSSKLDLDANATDKFGIGYASSHEADGRLKLTSSKPLTIGVKWTSHADDPRCKQPPPECPLPPQPPPPVPAPPQPSAPKVVLRSGNGRDSITITIVSNADENLRKQGKYQLVFRSGDPGQDRDLFDLTAGTAVKVFNQPPQQADVPTGENSPHVFRAQYGGLFGKYWMANPETQWAATISPGDRVTVDWGP